MSYDQDRQTFLFTVTLPGGTLVDRELLISSTGIKKHSEETISEMFDEAYKLLKYESMRTYYAGIKEQ